MNSSTSKNKRSKEENSTWTKQDLMKQKLNLKDKIDVFKITFKILHNSINVSSRDHHSREMKG